MVQWDLQALPESLVEGVDPAQMEPEECLDRQDPREIEDLMVSLVCPVKRDTGVRRVLRVHRGLQEKMEKEVTMVRSVPEACLVNRVLVVFWAPKVLKGLQDLLV